MRGADSRLLDDLGGYLTNVEFFLSLAELSDRDYFRVRFWPPGHIRANISELQIMKSDLTELRDFIKQCHQSGNELAIDMLIKMRIIATGAANDRHEIYQPLIERGRKELKDGRKANEAAYGTSEVRERMYREWQDALNTAHRKNPSATYEELKKRVAAQFKVGKSTVEKHTINPKKKPD